MVPTISMESYALDFQTRAKARLLAQFQGKPVMAQVLDAFSAEAQECYDATVEMMRQRTLAVATGINLEAIGRIVGQGKELTFDDTEFFFRPDNNDLGADKGVAYVTGASEGESIPPNDSQYLAQVVSRILKNANRFSSIPELQEAIKRAFGVNVSFVMDDEEPMCVAQVVCQYGTPVEVLNYLQQMRSDGRADLQPMVPYPATLKIKEVVVGPEPTLTISGVITAP